MMQALYINQDGSIKIDQARAGEGQRPARFVRISKIAQQRVAISPDGPGFDAMDALIETAEYELFDTIGPFAVYEEL